MSCIGNFTALKITTFCRRRTSKTFSNWSWSQRSEVTLHRQCFGSLVAGSATCVVCDWKPFYITWDEFNSNTPTAITREDWLVGKRPMCGAWPGAELINERRMLLIQMRITLRVTDTCCVTNRQHLENVTEKRRTNSKWIVNGHWVGSLQDPRGCRCNRPVVCVWSSIHTMIDYWIEQWPLRQKLCVARSRLNQCLGVFARTNNIK